MTDEEFIPDEVRPGRRSRYRFTRTPQWVLLMPELSDAGYRAYSLLLAHVNTERGDGAVWPRQKSLASMLNKGANAISRVINAELVPLGLVDVEPVRYGPNNTRRRNIYTVHEEPPAGWSGHATIQEWYAAHPPEKDVKAAQPGDTKNRVTGEAKNRVSGDTKNRVDNETNCELDEELQQDGAPSARSADARRAPDGSSGRRARGGSAAAGKKSATSRIWLSREQATAVATVERAVPESLLELLPHQQLPNTVRLAIVRELECRTAKQLAGRVARRWVFHGYQKALLAGEGLRRPVAVAHVLVRAGECPDAGCEDGVIVDSGADCRACEGRKANRKAAGGKSAVPVQRSGRPTWECVACRNPKWREPEPEDGVCQACNDEAVTTCEALAASLGVPPHSDAANGALEATEPTAQEASDR